MLLFSDKWLLDFDFVLVYAYRTISGYLSIIPYDAAGTEAI